MNISQISHSNHLLTMSGKFLPKEEKEVVNVRDPKNAGTYVHIYTHIHIYTRKCIVHFLTEPFGYSFWQISAKGGKGSCQRERSKKGECRETKPK